MTTPLPKVKHSKHQPPAIGARRQTPRATGARAASERSASPPVGGVSSRLIGLAASMVIVFLLATTLFMSSNLAADLNILGVAGFAVIFFTLTLSLSSHAARDPRWAGDRRRADNTLDSLARGRVAIATGTISGRDAMVQVLVLPVTLAAGMVVIGLIFAMGL